MTLDLLSSESLLEIVFADAGICALIHSSHVLMRFDRCTALFDKDRPPVSE